MHRFTLLTPLLALAAASPLTAQRASLRGVVVDSASGTPIQGVRVTLIDVDISTMTDSDGAFRFFGLASGTHTLAARQLGYEPVAIRFQLNAEQTPVADIGTLHLTSTVVELDPVVVEADLVRDYPQMEGFFRRRRVEQGTFFTEQEVRAQNPQETSDLIRKIPGFNTTQFGQISSGRGTAGMSQAMNACMVQAYVNGVKVNAPTIDVIQPETIIGVEVYNGSSTVPPVFRSGSNANCGVIAIWTRHTRR